jgi:hypothetical protein
MAGSALAPALARAMVAPVKLQYWALSALCLAGPMACKDKGEAFLGLPDLCPSRAHDICSARALCCEQGAESACEAHEKLACDQQRGQFTSDQSLTYNSEFAEQQRAAQQHALEQCEDPLPLGAFFEGTLPAGEGCERDTQCQSGHCDLPEGAESGTCAEEPVALCPSPE